jgi:hypothetical protein
VQVSPPGPPRWVVSVGVLVGVGVIGATGTFVLDRRGADPEMAAVRATVPSAGWVPAETAPTGWQVVTPTYSGSVGPGPAASGTGSVEVSSTGPTTRSTTTPPAASPAPSDRIDPADPSGTAASGSRVAVRSVPAGSRTGTGRLVAVPGSVPAPGRAPSMRVRVEVEQGLGVDPTAFARFVLATLNDPRGWSHGDALSFARTDGPADFRVVLGSADLARGLCATHPGDPTSCGGGDRAVIAVDRWLDGAESYRDDLTAFRRFAINHEVGHVLGRSNAFCTPGHLAPVMVDQARGLFGCLRNAWPYPSS